MSQEAPKSVLVVGGGGREHAIGWKLSEDAKRFHEPVKLYFAPGNGGTSNIGTNLDIDATDINRQVDSAKEFGIGFVIYGPEAPLIAGAVDEMKEAGIAAFGPTAGAARLEGSKIWAVEIMEKYGVPHPNSIAFDSYEAARNLILRSDVQKIVIKADGQALGKGVLLPQSESEAISWLRDAMVKKTFGQAGERVLVQERLKGDEVSAIGFVSNSIGLLVPARDYKRVFDNDRGPNTGGMGGYAPNDSISQEQLEEIYHRIFLPIQQAMIQEGIPYIGALYAGVMLTDRGPMLLEINARMGDPETQVQLPRLKTPLLPAMEATVRGNLTSKMLESDQRSSVGVVVAMEGYPGSYEKGNDIYIGEGLPRDVIVFHGGTAIRDDELLTSGGRVLTVLGTGKTRGEAREKVYQVLEGGDVYVDGGFFRRDIGA